ncbi:reverse transcriptase domain-containing protein, partial [Burkholderia pseudomallei]|uniref:reverse transcriptase domain-containing protein n=1 Tax=Burkholderia pseudomallei TaxID=28450 RepID=UPI0034585069
IIRNGLEQKLSLYADDLLLYVTDPATSIPVILTILDNFGSFSGYKLNLHKSEYYPVNSSALQLQHLNLPFKLNCSGFKYLGITVTRSLSDLSHANFSSLISDVKSDFQRWSNLPLSLT